MRELCVWDSSSFFYASYLFEEKCFELGERERELLGFVDAFMGVEDTSLQRLVCLFCFLVSSSLLLTVVELVVDVEISDEREGGGGCVMYLYYFKTVASCADVNE